jgi:hypothetical protein
MARGLWDDFRGKYGFSDGEKVRPIDLKARDTDTVVAYDRPGLHNYCLLLVLPNPGGKQSRSQLLRRFVKDPHSVECKRRSKNRPRHAVRAGDAAEGK